MDIANIAGVGILESCYRCQRYGGALQITISVVS